MGEGDLSDQAQQHLSELVRQAVARAARVATAVAATEDNLAGTWDRMALQRPDRAAELQARSREAREQATRMRRLARRHLDRMVEDRPE